MTLKKIILLPLFTTSLLLASSGSSIYKKECKSCHGAKGDKVALNKSKAINGMSVATLDQAMKNYVSGKRKSMAMIKKMKKKFMTKHSEEEIQAVYKYIHEL